MNGDLMFIVKQQRLVISMIGCLVTCYILSLFRLFNYHFNIQTLLRNKEVMMSLDLLHMSG